MAAARKNLLVDLGTTFNLTFEYRFDGSPIDLSGNTIEFKLTKPGDRTAVYHTENFSGGADGRVSLNIDDEVTAGWTFPKAAYNVDLIDPDNNRRGLLWGTLTVRDRSDV